MTKFFTDFYFLPTFFFCRLFFTDKVLNFNFLTNNVKGLQSSKKRVKIFQYFRNKVAPKGFLLLQETYYSVETEKQWNDKFKGQLYFCLGKTNSCGVLTGFYGNINVATKKLSNDENGRILILEVTTDDTEYLLINIYDSNTEQHQLETLPKSFYFARKL